jgi:hypothetical protein
MNGTLQEYVQLMSTRRRGFGFDPEERVAEETLQAMPYFSLSCNPGRKKQRYMRLTLRISVSEEHNKKHVSQKMIFVV